MKLRQTITILAIVASCNLAAWLLFREQTIPTQWIGPSAFGCTTLGALVIAVILAGVQARLERLHEPAEHRGTPPDDNPWTAQVMLFGGSDREALQADLYTAGKLGAVKVVGKGIELTPASAEVLHDRIQRLLQPLQTGQKRYLVSTQELIRRKAARQAGKQINYTASYVMPVGLFILVMGLSIAAPLGETTKPLVTILSWVIASALYLGTHTLTSWMMWSAKARLVEVVTAIFCVAVLAMAGLQAQWPDLMPFWFLGFSAITLGLIWPLCWRVKGAHQTAQMQWAAYWHTLRGIVASNDPTVLERHRAMLIALHLNRR